MSESTEDRRSTGLIEVCMVCTHPRTHLEHRLLLLSVNRHQDGLVVSFDITGVGLGVQGRVVLVDAEELGGGEGKEEMDGVVVLCVLWLILGVFGGLGLMVGVCACV